MLFVEQPALSLLEAKLLRRYSFKENCLMYFQGFSVRRSQSSSFKSFMTEVLIILKLSYWFALQINVLVAIEWTSVMKDLKRFTKRAMITSFHWVPYARLSTNQAAKKMETLMEYHRKAVEICLFRLSQSICFKAFYEMKEPINSCFHKAPYTKYLQGKLLRKCNL